jgi:hypothetical protein
LAASGLDKVFFTGPYWVSVNPLRLDFLPSAAFDAFINTEDQWLARPGKGF